MAPEQVSGSYLLRLTETWMLPRSSPTLPLGSLVCQEAAVEGRKKATEPSTGARPLPTESLHSDAAGPRPGAAPFWAPGSHLPNSSSGLAQGWLGSGTVEDTGQGCHPRRSWEERGQGPRPVLAFLLHFQTLGLGSQFQS